MSPQAGFVLQDQVIPRLRSAIPNVVHCVGAECHNELIQDSIAMACSMMAAVEKAGKKVTPGSIVNTPRGKDDPSAPRKYRIDRLLDGIGIIGYTICLGAKLLGRDDILRWHIWNGPRFRPDDPQSQQHGHAPQNSLVVTRQRSFALFHHLKMHV